MKNDFLFIHTPKISQKGKINIMTMAMGVFALADCLEKEGYSSKIIHLGIEKIINNKFSIINYLKKNKISLIGISLHWHQQLETCLNLINKIKMFQPKTKIILGGFTASILSDRIMVKNKNVDFIIKGDAEMPLVNLVKVALRNKSDFSSIPNLIWRKGDKVINNEHSYVAGEEDINKLNFSNFTLMKNFSAYLRIPIELASYSKDSLLKFRTLDLFIGRGCSVNCSYCGGSKLSQKLINNRNKVIFRNPRKVLETIKDAAKAGVELLYICFDPCANREYYISLFKLIRDNKINMSAAFECWSLPDFKFIDEFKKTFGEGRCSRIIVSPDSGSEKIRRLNKGFFYKNSELLTTLAYLRKKEISTEIYFGYTLPYENTIDFHQTNDLINTIKKKVHNRCTILIHRMDFDPLSPVSINPVKYQMVKK